MNKIFLCHKLTGKPFAVLTIDEAKEWIKQDPECNYYDEIKIETLNVSSNDN